jgi:hypothetical protein
MATPEEIRRQKQVNLQIFIDSAEKIGVDASKEKEELNDCLTGSYTDIQAMKRIKIREIDGLISIDMKRPVFGNIDGVDCYFDIEIQAWESKIRTMQDARRIDWPTVDLKIISLSKKDATGICEHVRSRRLSLSMLRKIALNDIMLMDDINDVRCYDMEL